MPNPCTPKSEAEAVLQIRRRKYWFAFEPPLPNKVPQDRAGVIKGSPAKITAKHMCDKTVQITEIFAQKQRSKLLYVANIRKNPQTGKAEYQLRETKQETGSYYRNGHWFPEKEVRNA
ncbi:hypothetical protein FB567DRAFT_597679 [Paraphoma chrysanthemicola]|uniref:Uncharacterized protein n=1 Tax=Paraphoma chrysanthemicola TaxID=798071 RepID=A0A8K0VU04_9PLEO|nr:hypothetical protein FB567DRAFT_597679 [Paraphoma chrysanthemicola]